MFDTTNCYKDLGLAIVTQAVEDYKLLQEMGLDSYNFFDEGNINKKEIESFFRSEWCNLLLEDMPFTGIDILEYLNK